MENDVYRLEHCGGRTEEFINQLLDALEKMTQLELDHAKGLFKLEKSVESLLKQSKKADVYVEFFKSSASSYDQTSKGFLKTLTSTIRVELGNLSGERLGIIKAFRIGASDRQQRCRKLEKQRKAVELCDSDYKKLFSEVQKYYADPSITDTYREKKRAELEKVHKRLNQLLKEFQESRSTILATESDWQQAAVPDWKKRLDEIEKEKFKLLSKAIEAFKSTHSSLLSNLSNNMGGLKEELMNGDFCEDDSNFTRAEEPSQIPDELHLKIPSPSSLRPKNDTENLEKLKKELTAIEQLLRMGESNPAILSEESKMAAEKEYVELANRIRSMSVNSNSDRGRTVAWTDESEEDELKSPKLKARVLYDFSARSPAELSVQQGEMVEIEGQGASEDWVLVMNGNGKVGHVPSAYIQNI